MMAAGTLGNLASSLYQQNNYRNATRQVNDQYRQWVSDYQKNTGQKIRYDKLPSNASGMLFQNENVGIPNSYAQTWGTAFSGIKSFGTMGLGYKYANKRFNSNNNRLAWSRGGGSRWV